MIIKKIQNIHNDLRIILLCMMIIYGCLCKEEQSQEMQKIKKFQQDLQFKISFQYNQNTQQIAFPLNYHINDFVVKAIDDEEIKFVLKAFSKKDNVYSPSQYRHGQEIGLMIFEASVDKIFSANFYQAYSAKFKAKKNVQYFIRFIYSGSVSKVITMELSQQLALPQNIQKKDENFFGEKMISLAYQLQSLLYSSSFTDTVHIQNSNIVIDGIRYYMRYLAAQAVIVIIIVGIQLKMLTKMLRNDIII